VSYASDGSNDRLQAVIDIGIIPRLLELLGHPSANVQVPALRSLGNIVTGDDVQTQIVMDMGIIPALAPLLGNEV
jgi:hypothetical protein